MSEDDPVQREALIRARAEVMATMQRHGLAGFCVLACGGQIEVLTGLNAPWCKLTFEHNDEGETVGLRLKVSEDDYGGDAAAAHRDVSLTVGFAATLAEVLGRTALTWLELSQQMNEATGAEHTTLRQVHTQ